MGNPKGFMTIGRKPAGYRPVHERTKDYSEVEQTLERKRPEGTGLSLHGLWCSFLSMGMPGNE